MVDLKSELQQYGEVLEDVSFKTMTTLRIGGLARFVVYPKSILALTQLLREIKEANLPFKVLGKGSNLLCSDQYFDGVIIRLDRTFTDFYFDHEVCYAEAGCSIITIAYETIKHGLTGLEFASGIPGTVGGVTYMNAGAYKSNMSEVIDEVLVYHDGIIEWFSNKDCEFGYRHSIFHDESDWIILAIKIKLEVSDSESVRNLIEKRRERRMESQPLDFPSAGSVFRNPLENPAWYYIEGLGWRGRQLGGAKISDKHVNFIVNYDQAKAEDFLNLVHEIQVEVKNKYNVDLIMEVEKFNW